MEHFANNSVWDIAVQCSAQGAKTRSVMDCARGPALPDSTGCGFERPGSIADANDEAQFAELRV